MKKASESGIDYSTEGCKLTYRELIFEITRKCNMKCKHCMRGKAENHTISKEVINQTLEGVECVQSILLTGGEPFLEPEIIDFLFSEIIRREIPVANINVVTNGSILDERIALSFNKITEYIAETDYGKKIEKKQARQLGKIMISCDEFHSQVDIVETMRFYRKHLNKHTIIVREPAKPDEDILMLGNAVDNKELFNKIRWKVAPYRAELSKDFIETSIQIGWDGKLLIGEDSSYQQQDTYNYGNIMETPASVLLCNNAFNEPFTKKEANVYDIYYGLAKDGDEEAKAFIEYFNTIYELRKRMKIIYPFLDRNEICEAAYDDINVWVKKECGTDTPIFQIETMELYKKTLEESEDAQKKLFWKGLLSDPLHHIVTLSESWKNSEIETPPLRI